MFDSTAVNCRIIPGTAVGPLGIGLREVPGTDFGEVKRLGAGIPKAALVIDVNQERPQYVQ